MAEECRIFISWYYQALLLIDMVKALLGIGNILKIKLLSLASSLVFNTLPCPCAPESQNTILYVQSLIKTPNMSVVSGSSGSKISLAVVPLMQGRQRSLIVCLSLGATGILIFLIMNYWGLRIRIFILELTVV